MITEMERIYSTLLNRDYPQRLFGNLEGFEKKGSGYLARCPFHTDELATLVIYGDRPEYFCFACSARGDWLRYLQQKEGIGFHDAVANLSLASGIPVQDNDENRWNDDLNRTIILEQAMGFFNAQLFSPAGEEVLHYLYRRGYTMSEVEGSSLGYYPGFAALQEYLSTQGVAQQLLDEVLGAIWSRDAEDCRLVIPYRDSCGRLMGLFGRNSSLTGEAAYRPLTDLSALRDVPFLMYKARMKDELMIVEGLLDTLLIDQIGTRPVIGIGKSGLSPEQLNTIASYGTKHCILCLGGSERQQRYTRDAAGLIRDQGLGVSVLPLKAKYSDIDEFIRSHDVNEFRKLVKKPVSLEQWSRRRHS